MINLYAVLEFIVKQIFLQVPIFLGIIALIGLAALKRPLKEIFEHVTKVMVGVAAMLSAAGVLSTVARSIGDIMNEKLGVSGIIPWNLPAYANAVKLAPPNFPVNVLFDGTAAMVLAFVLNVISARVTRIKTIYLTPHFMNFIAILNVYTLAVLFPNLGDLVVIVISAILAWLYEWLGPAIGRIYTKHWIPDDAYTVGHSETIWGAVVSWIGKRIGKPEESIETAEFPPSLSMLADYIILSFIIMAATFIGTVIVVGEAIVSKYTGGINYIVWAITSAIQFTAAIVLLLTGVRLFIGSMSMAFKGISEKLIPGAKPAFDVPVIFALGPKALLLGALGSLIAAPIVTIAMIFLKSPVIVLPNAIWIYFEGGAMGIFADKVGGKKAAFLAGIISAVIQMIGAALFYVISGGSVANSGFIWHGPDLVTVYGIFYGLISVFK
ncbi:MAG: PTS transporter subunit IIC [Nitrososphaerota archaeon]